MEEEELPPVRHNRQDARFEAQDRSARSSRRGGFRGRRPSRKRARQPKKQLLQPSFPYISGESSGYGSDAAMSGSGDEIGERSMSISRVVTLPPIASSPTLETRTRTASPLTPTTLSPVKLSTPRHSGKSIRGQRPSLLSVSTSTASSGDSAVVLDFSAVSSQTSMKSRDHIDGETPCTSTGKSHLEPPVMVTRSQRQQHKPCRKPTKLAPLEVSAPTMSSNTQQSNLYLSDTYSNLTKRELYFQFQAPNLCGSSNQQSIVRQPAISSTSPRMTRFKALPPVGQSQAGQQQLPELQVLSSVIHQLPVSMTTSRVQSQSMSVNRPHNASWQEQLRYASQNNNGRLDILSNCSTIQNPNLRVVGGQQVSVSLDRGLGKAPLPSIGASPQLLASSSNLCLCRSDQDKCVEIQVSDMSNQVSDTEETHRESDDSRVPPPRLTMCRYGTANSSAESLTPNSSSFDFARLADGSIPQIYLIAPTPCPPTPLPPNPNYQNDWKL